MGVFTVTDAADIKDAVVTTDPDALTFIVFYNRKESSSISALPIIEELSNSTEFEDVRFYQTEINEAPELAEEYHVKNVPTFLFIKGGRVIDKLAGAKGEAEIKARLVENNPESVTRTLTTG